MFFKIIKSRIFITLAFFILIFIVGWNWPSKVSEYDYGSTFSAKYARELGIDPEKTFDAMTDELGIKKVRLIAYWDDIESIQGQYDFSDLDWQMKKAEEKDLEVILTVGRRVPRWPECHTPKWAQEQDWTQKKESLLIYMKEVINRYKDYDSLKIWQIENEPFLTVYVPEICGSELDKKLLDREIELVRQLDDRNRPVLTTDSGNLGTWSGAYKRGDIFGSTFYVYLSNETIGGFRTIANHNFYKAKSLLFSLIHGSRPTYLIEVSMEPWLTNSIPESTIEEQLEFMNIERLGEIIEMSAKTNFDEQYLWGVEWWYYLRVNGYPEIWDYLKIKLFNKDFEN